MIREPTLEDMCDCMQTKPLRARLQEINELYLLYTHLKNTQLPSLDYWHSFYNVKGELAYNCEMFYKTANNQLSKGEMLTKHNGKVSCKKCQTEIALPDPGIDAEINVSNSIICMEKQINRNTLLN